MTRINAGIHPSDLLDEWLIAEWRELPRIINELVKHPHRFNPDDIPSEFTLGNGHVKFFRDKGQYLVERHKLLRDEMDHRGIKRDTNVFPCVVGLDEALYLQVMKPWLPTPESNKEIVERLTERFSARKKPYHMTRLVKLVFNDDTAWLCYFTSHLKKYVE